MAHPNMTSLSQCSPDNTRAAHKVAMKICNERFNRGTQVNAAPNTAAAQAACADGNDAKASWKANGRKTCGSNAKCAFGRARPITCFNTRERATAADELQKQTIPIWAILFPEGITEPENATNTQHGSNKAGCEKSENSPASVLTASGDAAKVVATRRSPKCNAKVSEARKSTPFDISRFLHFIIRFMRRHFPTIFSET